MTTCSSVSSARLTLGSSVAARPRPYARRPRLLVLSSKDADKKSGIHDPIGWGQRGGMLKSHEAGLEQQRQLQAQALAGQQARSEASHPPGHTSGGKDATAQREILAVEQEKAEMQRQQPQQAAPQQSAVTASQDEYDHMSQPQKWYMELKAVLYSWLGTGVEPL